jgi:hypothetical protein
MTLPLAERCGTQYYVTMNTSRALRSHYLRKNSRIGESSQGNRSGPAGGGAGAAALAEGFIHYSLVVLI